MAIKDPLLIDWKKVHADSIKVLTILSVLPDPAYIPEGPAKAILRQIAQEIVDTLTEVSG